MVRGYIYGDRYKLKWLPEEKSLLLGLWAIGSIKLGEFAGFGRPKVGANMCQACRKFIIDM
ncbi:TPA: hypothetical protein DCG35_04105 [Candidatus Edwardsbacteria bacterium]|nr:hypothetical protein [Candidatus Edwardsbacteria bacterium]